MKLIGSKAKDYFDYLIYQYGEDPLVVLDRRPVAERHSNGWCGDVQVEKSYLTTHTRCHLATLGFRSDDYIQEFLICNGIAYPIVQKKGEYMRFELANDKNSRYPERKGWWAEFNPNATKFTQLCQLFKRHALILLGNSVYGEFPHLQSMGLDKVVAPQDMYIQTVEFITQHLSDKPEAVVKQTSNEKIVAHGFDLKKSFRGK